MKTRGDLWALVAVALALSSTSTSETQGKEVPEGDSVTNAEPIDHFSELWVYVITKAWNDETFKQELLANPAQALETHFNYKVPPEVHLEIVESQPGHPAPYKLTVTLPAKPALVREPRPAEGC
ncbi:BMA_0021/BMA_0022 family TOMM bacteriocin [Polyangium mundeleinium]|uniref:BMA_0021/BMA_0022 family TOMM bacteriocin n=1 Tax=Polyangium mundeleinium TaxID=2995306 RepID=A0ABT5ESL0_9BACT|nr:BMA_0021/BMA_0022 family TOMM bacteriocin [Polyangium mundeleinium]MDC0744796.1 BMA_0021/BMA_0022 family TOMM bacteriocin [Polyangium mundeleinium]